MALLQCERPMQDVTINGFCDSRFTAIESAFTDNFTLHGEVGAAVRQGADLIHRIGIGAVDGLDQA